MRLCQLGGGDKVIALVLLLLHPVAYLLSLSPPFASVFLISNGVKLAHRDKLGPSERVTPAFP